MASVLLVAPPEEVAGETFDGLAALAERRHADLEHVQP